MPVRRKIFFVMTVMSVLVFVVVYALSRIILEPGSNANEKLRVSDNVLRVRSAVDREVADLDRQTRDFASRQGPGILNGERRDTGLSSELLRTALIDNEFDVVICADLAGRVAAARAYDRLARTERSVPESLFGRLAPGNPLLRREADTSGLAGLLVLPEGAFLVSSRPIPSGDGSGHAAGTLLAARALDGAAVSKLGDITHLPLRSVPLAGSSAREGGEVRILGPNRIAGFALLNDVFEQPAFLLTFDSPRTYHFQFLYALRYFLSALLVYTAISFSLGQWLMDKLVSSRLSRLAVFMKDVERSGDLDTRLKLPGQDEVAGLASGLNGMLDALSRHVAAIKAAEEAVKRSEAKYRALFDAANDAIFLETQDGRILDCNPAATRLFGRDKADLIGVPRSSLLEEGPEVDQERLREEMETRGFMFVERVGRKPTGETFPCEVSVRAARIGRSSLLVTFVHDTTERARSEEQLRTSLREKEVLLREVHHRVKNNMQIISSLFNLQTGTIKDPSAITLLRECQMRIRSMALVHEKLYQSKDMARIPFSDYLRSLAMYLFHFWQVNEDRIKLDMRIANVLLDINTAIPLGQIVNELISNALEHAFPDGRVGEIRIRLIALEASQFELIVEDDGIGLPPGVDVNRSETLGLQLVGLLVRQLDGTIEASSDGGARFRLVVNALKYQQRF
jgi:PAS domain S-box-containing protein